MTDKVGAPQLAGSIVSFLIRIEGTNDTIMLGGYFKGAVLLFACRIRGKEVFLWSCIRKRLG